MASISNDPNGRRRILFIGADGQRKPIRLGKVTDEQFQAVWDKAKRYHDAETDQELRRDVTNPRIDDRAKLAMMVYLRDYGNPTPIIATRQI